MLYVIPDPSWLGNYQLVLYVANLAEHLEDEELSGEVEGYELLLRSLRAALDCIERRLDPKVGFSLRD